MSKDTHIAFTICSNNYLGQAMALKDSLLKHNPDFQFTIVLVDKLSPQVDYSRFEPARILPVAEIPGLDVADLVSRYYIIELNTSVKPSVFKYLKTQHPEAKAIYYLDPDLYFYSSLTETNNLLESHSAVLTPHILSPIPRDGQMPDENLFFRFGIYNLGFLGVNPQHPETLKMLDWWEDRNLKYGYDRPQQGYFVDQLWMQYAPLFYKDVWVLKSFAYNMAPWNLHERRIESIENSQVTLNDGSELVFYHFSKLASNDTAISREYTRYELSDFPKLAKLYRDYKQEMVRCDFEKFKKIPIAYPVHLKLQPPKVSGSVFKKWAIKFGQGVTRWAKKLP